MCGCRGVLMHARKIITLIISHLSLTDKTVSPLFPTQFPKFEYTAAMRRDQLFEILNFSPVVCVPTNYRKNSIFF